MNNYIILYGHSHCEEIYGIAKGKTEAKRFIKNCLIEIGCSEFDITCLRVEKVDFETEVKVRLK